MSHSRIRFDPVQGHCCIEGELTLDTVAQLWPRGLECMSGRTCLTFDLERVTHSDSAALSALLAWMRYAKQHNMTLSFMNVPKQLRQIAKAYGLTKVFSWTN